MGKVIVITGAGSGLGRSIALRLARSGNDVVLLGRTLAGVPTQRRVKILEQSYWMRTNSSDHMNSRLLRHLINLWPPYLFTGIHAASLSADYRSADVELRERFYNRNYVGTHFGGSLFAMTDAWYMIMLLHNLGKDYYVWDKQAAIEYLSPGRGTLRAKFYLDDAILQRILERTADGEKYLPVFEIDVVNAENKPVARVTRTLYVRKKKSLRYPADGAESS